jgi:SAM-dependent methyltransferase
VSGPGDRDASRPPAHLNPWNAAAFALEDVVASYPLRLPYPAELVPFLLGLRAPGRNRVLELGCGTGEIARALAPHVERVDAVDVSPAMLARAKTLPGGTHPALRWIEGAAETVTLAGPYALAVAADAIHWMDWDLVLPRVARALSPAASLVLVSKTLVPAPPWQASLSAVIARYSVIRDFEPFGLDDVASGLAARGLFRQGGAIDLEPTVYEQPVEDYISALHSTAGMPRERMGAMSTPFDREVRALVEPHAVDGRLRLGAAARVIWGTSRAS